MVLYALAPATIIEPPVQQPSPHSLVATIGNSAPDDPHWEMGVQFLPMNSVAASTWNPEATTEVSGGPAVPIAGGSTLLSGGGKTKSTAPTNVPVQTFIPYTLESPFSCSDTGFNAVNYEQRAQQQVELGTANQVEYQFWTGLAGDPNNYSLMNACPATPATATGGVLNSGSVGSYVTVGPERAVAMLVGALSSAGNGAKGVIHAPAILAELFAEGQGLSEDDNGNLITKSRADLVVSGGGYPGTGPVGTGSQQTPPYGQIWAYATDMVSVLLSDVVVYPDNYGEALNRVSTPGAGPAFIQTIEFRGERTAAAFTSGLFTFAILVDMSLPT